MRQEADGKLMHHWLCGHAVCSTKLIPCAGMLSLLGCRSADVRGVMEQNRAMLAERGERLAALDERTREMADDAEDFATMARRLEQQMANRKWCVGDALPGLGLPLCGQMGPLGWVHRGLAHFGLFAPFPGLAGGSCEGGRMTIRGSHGAAAHRRKQSRSAMSTEPKHQ